MFSIIWTKSDFETAETVIDNKIMAKNIEIIKKHLEEEHENKKKNDSFELNNMFPSQMSDISNKSAKRMEILEAVFKN